MNKGVNSYCSFPNVLKGRNVGLRIHKFEYLFVFAV